MSDRLKALREERAKIVTDMQAITDLATNEKRDMTGEEAAKHAELFDLTETKRAGILAEERQTELARELAANAADAEKRAAEAAAAGNGNDNALTSEQRQAASFNGWLESGELRGDGIEEIRALQAGTDTLGGYLVPPEQFVNQLIKFVDDMLFIRGLSTTFTVANADSLGAPSLDADPADADWTPELGTGDEDSAMAFGKRNLHPHPLAKRIKVSNTLMQRAVMGVESLVMQRLAYKFAVTQEKVFLTGTGAQQPLGLFTASADGISTGRDVSTGNTTTGVTFDGLIEAKYNLKGNYWGAAQWLFHRDAMKQISKLKDGEGQYIWRASTQAGEPDMILGHPVNMSEHVPNTFTTGLYVGMIGDYSNYWIADALTMQMQRLVELYAATNQIGFIGRQEVDGMPVLEEAFSRVTLA